MVSADISKAESFLTQPFFMDSKRDFFSAAVANFSAMVSSLQLLSAKRGGGGEYNSGLTAPGGLFTFFKLRLRFRDQGAELPAGGPCFLGRQERYETAVQACEIKEFVYSGIHFGNSCVRS